MAKYEAFPVFVGYPASVQPATWNVVMRSMDGSVAASAKILATFHGDHAEKDAKCHAAKLNERESGAAYPERYDGSKEVEEALPLGGVLPCDRPDDVDTNDQRRAL